MERAFPYYRRLGGLILVLAGTTTWASDVAGGRLETPPTIDGAVGETEWSDAILCEGGVDEETRTPATRGQKIWVAYDSEYVYFAARLEEPDPRRIRAVEYETNTDVTKDDCVELALDPFGNLGDTNKFLVNPKAATTLQLAGGRALKREWLGEIVAAGRVIQGAWEVEAKIPWRIMRLPEPGPRDVRFNVSRYVASEGRTYVWRYTEGGNRLDTPTWKAVEIPRIPQERLIRLLPYGYAGARQGGEPIVNLGLDLKTSLGRSLEVVGTVSPDFRNIENDVLSLDHSYFERLPGERRPFFNEGQSYFSAGYDTRIFAPQRIRRVDVGLKAFGKIGNDFSFGVLDAADLGESNAFVAAASYKSGPRASFYGAVASLARTDQDNTAAHVNASYLLGPATVYGTHQWTKDAESGFGVHRNVGAWANWPGLEAWVDYSEISPEFRPRLGFARETDLKGLAAGLDWSRTNPTGPVMETGVSLEAVEYRRWTGGPYRKGIEARASLTMRDGLDLDLGYERGRFEMFDDEAFSVSLEKPRGDVNRRWSLSAVFGRVEGERYRSLGAGIAYRPVQRLQTLLRAQAVRKGGDSRTQTIASASYDLRASQSISGRLVAEDGSVNWYLAYRKSGNIGTEYYVILGDPNAWTFQRSLIVKVVVPVDWRF